MKFKTTMRAALEDPKLLGNVLAGDTWEAWRVVLIAAMGEALTCSERRLFLRLTGRDREPRERVDELWAAVGRRGGKSRSMSVLSAFLGGLVDYSDVLSPGETGVVLCIAPDQKQAGIVLNYTEAAFANSPILRKSVVKRSADALELTNGVSIEVRASSFRRLRGPTYCAVLADEAAFWFSEDSSNPDSEILGSVRPGLATTGGPLIVASSPYAKRGELYRTYRKHYGPEGDPAILVVQGASRDLNPSLPQSVVDRALERDHAAASAEYLAQFRSDIESFISREAVEACVTHGVRERAPIDGLSYVAFTDPSGGSNDSFTLAIAHRENGKCVIDALRETRPPFSPSSVIAEYAALLKTYRIRAVRGDRYAGEFPREAFRKFNISYAVSSKTRSELYIDLLPAINSASLDLLDNDRAINQIASLERRTARSGRDSIDHAPGAHDDLANVIAGAASEAAFTRIPIMPMFGPVVVGEHTGKFETSQAYVGVS